MTKNNTHLTPLDSDSDSFVRDIWEMSMTSSESLVESDRVTVDQCTSDIKEIDRVESRRSPVGAIGDPDSILVPRLGEMNCTKFNPNGSHYTASDALELDNSNVESSGKLYDITLNPYKEPHSVNKLGDSNNHVTWESNDTTVDALLESDIMRTSTPTETIEI